MYIPTDLQTSFEDAIDSTHGMEDFIHIVRRRVLHSRPRMCDEVHEKGVIYDVFMQNTERIFEHLTQPAELREILYELGATLAENGFTSDMLAAVAAAFRATLEETLTPRGLWNGNLHQQWERCCFMLMRLITDGMAPELTPYPDPPKSAA